MRYLVTGGAGYLGSHLVTQLISSGDEVIVFDDYSGSLKTRFPSSVRQIQGSITNKNDLSQLDGEGKIEGIFHLAAKKSVSESNEKPDLYWETNVVGTNNLLEYCDSQQIKKIILTSSAAVYGSLELERPIKETDATIPLNVYGNTKLEAEKIVSEFSIRDNHSAISLRLFNLSGADNPKLFDENGENVIPIILRCLKGNEVFQIFGNNLPTPDGSCLRDYVNVNDAAAAHVKAMRYLNKEGRGKYFTMNIASGIGVSVKQLLGLVSKLSEKEIRQLERSRRDGDPISSVGDASLALQIINWKAERDIDRIVRESLRL